MPDHGTQRIRIRIAVAVTSNGDWVAFGSSGKGAVTADALDESNKHRTVFELRQIHGGAYYRINMVEADVIRPILDDETVVVQANQ